MITTRFAPSPTGYLHIGGLRTALYSYLWAKKNEGKFLLRIEDTDLARNSKEAAQAIEDAFSWLNFKSNGGIIYQSQRFDIYKKYIDQLLKEGKAYKCYMSKDELQAMRNEQEANKQRTKYEGKYRDFTGIPPLGIEPVIRIKAPQEGSIKFVDGIKGDISFEVKDVLDDFIIARSDGVPTYNFVVTVDDALMGINEVIRGDDHLMNTPKQIVVYQALNFDIPKFYHVPMILNENGKKLSKRDGATDVMEYQKLGFLPEALINFLVRLGWSHKDQEIFSFDELLKYFDPNNINKSASIYNTSKLEWLNAEYIKAKSTDELVELLKTYELDISNYAKKEFIIETFKPRVATMIDLKDKIESILNSPTSYDVKGIKKFLKDRHKENLKKFSASLSISSASSVEDYEEFLNEFLENNEEKLPHMAQPLRLALVGSTNAPSIGDLLYLFDKNEILSRIDKILNNYEG